MLAATSACGSSWTCLFTFFSLSLVDLLRYRSLQVLCLTQEPYPVTEAGCVRCFSDSLKASSSTLHFTSGNMLVLSLKVD